VKYVPPAGSVTNFDAELFPVPAGYLPHTAAPEGSSLYKKNELDELEVTPMPPNDILELNTPHRTVVPPGDA
jgi:hypothetical protein